MDPAPVMIYLDSSATLSPDERYRYKLTRRWGAPGPDVVFIGLNPSTADATRDDATIRKCVGFADRWGFRQLTMVNLFAFRATDPADMKVADDPVGPDNDMTLAAVCRQAIMVVACWSNHGAHRDRDVIVREALRAEGIDLLCLGTTLQFQPKHPARLAYATPLTPYYVRS